LVATARPETRVARTSTAGRRYLTGALAGLALPFAFAPFDWFALAPLCYAALFLSWYGAAPRVAAGSGFCFGLGGFLFGIHWIYISVGVFSPAPTLLAIGLTVGLAAAMAVYPAIVGWVQARWCSNGGARVWLLVLPALFVLAEWLRGWLLTGFGWLSAGYSQTDSWLAGYAPVLGLHGVSLAVLLLAGVALTIALGSRRERMAALTAGAAIITAGAVLDGREFTQPKAGSLTAALVQGAVSQDMKWLPSQLPQTMSLYSELTSAAHGADLIVWPEAAIPQLYENMSRYLDDIERSAAAAGSTVMLGMLRAHPSTGTAQNAIFALGHPELVYVKRHLVPYGEYFPVPDFVKAWLRSLDLPTIDTVPGEAGQPPFALLGERIAITICYEDVFGAEQLHSLPEATLLVNVSNDAWFGESIAADQHLQIARMRALEAGRYLLRSTNTGITAVIDPHGNVVERLPQFEPGVLTASVRGFSGATPYANWGNAAVLVLCAGLLLGYAATTKFTMRPGT
jgi:apolipoprotein N-acyltransferase